MTHFGDWCAELKSEEKQMILHCIGCGKPCEVSVSLIGLTPTCLDCAVKPHLRELVLALRQQPRLPDSNWRENDPALAEHLDRQRKKQDSELLEAAGVASKRKLKRGDVVEYIGEGPHPAKHTLMGVRRVFDASRAEAIVECEWFDGAEDKHAGFAESEVKFYMGGVSSISDESLPQATPQSPSAIVHIHEWLYVDAAKVVSVKGMSQSFREAELACTKIVYQEHGEHAACHVFSMPTLAAAQQLAREIVHRVNQGRFPMGVGVIRTDWRDVICDGCGALPGTDHAENCVARVAGERKSEEMTREDRRKLVLSQMEYFTCDCGCEINLSLNPKAKSCLGCGRPVLPKAPTLEQVRNAMAAAAAPSKLGAELHRRHPDMWDEQGKARPPEEVLAIREANASKCTCDIAATGMDGNTFVNGPPIQNKTEGVRRCEDCGYHFDSYDGARKCVQCRKALATPTPSEVEACRSEYAAVMACTCDIAATGCICGAFEREQAEKREAEDLSRQSFK